MRSIAEIFSSHEILDEQGRHINGTDKNGPNHHYGAAYESLFWRPDTYEDFSGRWLTTPGYSLRNSIKLMMEIGIADGSSLLAWTEVFPNARCVGMDIHVAERIAGGRYNNTEFHLGDQRCKEDCERAAGHGCRQFDVIVEDATHILENTLLTLYWLWPFVKIGGMYIVEEWSGVDRGRIKALWPFAEVVDTIGPSGGIEPLVIFRRTK